jgi:hypothetical protein
MDSKQEMTTKGVIVKVEKNVAGWIYHIAEESRGDGLVIHIDPQEYWDYQIAEKIGQLSIEDGLTHSLECIRKMAIEESNKPLPEPKIGIASGDIDIDAFLAKF